MKFSQANDLDFNHMYTIAADTNHL